MPSDLRALDALHLRHDGPMPEDLRLTAALGGPTALQRRRDQARARLYERLLCEQVAAVAAARMALLRAPDHALAATLAQAVRALPALRRQALVTRHCATP